jgi:hypothetical protein
VVEIVQLKPPLQPLASPAYADWTSDRVVVFVWLTTWLSAADLLGVKEVLPLYVAAMVCVPSASIESVNSALSPLTLTVPRVFVPSRKVTVPVTVPPNSGTTVAVKVTACPKVDGFNEELNDVVLSALATTWTTALDVLAAKFASPP